tara:strand:- start:275 stop:427 length:153 start_codon:yes stop_codon:yes gene_type:complete
VHLFGRFTALIALFGGNSQKKPIFSGFSGPRRKERLFSLFEQIISLIASI